MSEGDDERVDALFRIVFSSVYNPAFDATPLNLVTAIITEGGIYRPPEMPDLG